MKAREVKRAKLVAKYAEKRAALKQIVRTGDPAEAFEAAQKLQELPKNSNPIRMHNRCKLTGRPKGYIRQFGVSRIQFREMASNGLIPGVKKASWLIYCLNIVRVVLINLIIFYMTDPIADYLTRLRNAISAKHRVVEVPASNLKKEITKILFEKGYILNYKFVEDGPQGTIKVALKYDSVNKVNAIKKLERVSSPGMRKYTGYKDMPRVINGLGIAIISTSKGVMTNKEGAELKIGGEVLCYVY